MNRCRGFKFCSLSARIAALSALWILVPSRASADDTATLPAGVMRVRMRPIFNLASERWNQDGSTENITHDLDNRVLDSEVFPDLSTLERVYGFQSGALTVGTSHVRSQVQIFALAVAGELGITERLTAGLVVPIVHGRHVLETLALDPMNECDVTHCGLARNPGDTIVSREDAKYLPLDHDKDPSTRLARPLTVDDVQTILADDLAYSRLGDWAATGLGDIELGAKYRAFELGPYRAAFQAGVRLPTGRTDDPDQLLDLAFGDGQWDAAMAWQNDLVLTDELLLNATVRFTVQLPDHETKRVPTSVDVPLAKQEDTEEVFRNLGDVFDLDLGLAYRILPELSAYVGYGLLMKAEDVVRGNRGLAYRSLMDETALQNHSLSVGATFSTVPWVLAKEYWLPLDVSAAFARSIAGKNNGLVSNVFSVEAAVYFEVL